MATNRQSVFDQHQKKPQRGLSAHSSYHPGGYGVSEGLKRARRPFVVRNILVGGTLTVTAINLYLYSIYKVSLKITFELVLLDWRLTSFTTFFVTQIKQDDFSDIGVPAGTPAGAPVPANQAKASSIAATPDTLASQSTSSKAPKERIV